MNDIVLTMLPIAGSIFALAGTVVLGIVGATIKKRVDAETALKVDQQLEIMNARLNRGMENAILELGVQFAESDPDAVVDVVKAQMPETVAKVGGDIAKNIPATLFRLTKR